MKIGDPYFLYMLECNGDIPTKKGKMMRYVLRYLEGDDITFEDVGLDRNEMTNEDYDFITNEIYKRSPSYI